MSLGSFKTPETGNSTDIYFFPKIDAMTKSYGLGESEKMGVYHNVL